MVFKVGMRIALETTWALAFVNAAVSHDGLLVRSLGTRIMIQRTRTLLLDGSLSLSYPTDGAIGADQLVAARFQRAVSSYRRTGRRPAARRPKWRMVSGPRRHPASTTSAIGGSTPGCSLPSANLPSEPI